MIENFGRYNEYIDNIDVKGDQIPDSVNENLIKDISPLAIAVNFGDVLNSIEKTTNEGVILPNSRVIITDRFRLDDVNYIDVKQIK